MMLKREVNRPRHSFYEYSQILYKAIKDRSHNRRSHFVLRYGFIGQTGTGKTYSMQGLTTPPEHKGIIPRTFEQIFHHISVTNTKQFLVRCSYLEIYNEELRDLLATKQVKLDLKENSESGVYVKDLSVTVVKTPAEMEATMLKGNGNRVVGATLMNAESSRSHSIFSITIETSEKNALGEDHIKVGKLHLVDLAGSERQSKTGAAGDRLKEATKINLSLSALGNCISALVDGKSKHIPYRDSKLTRLLQDSLGGNSKTLMIATMSPADYNYEESLSTLRYAQRTKSIQNKPKVNEDPKDAMLREYQDEIDKLKAMLNASTVRKSPKKSREKKTTANETTIQDESGSGDMVQDIAPAITLEKDIQSRNSALEAKEAAAKQLAERALEIDSEKASRKEMEEKLQALQNRLLQGGDDIQSSLSAQQMQVQERERAIAEQRMKDIALQQKLEQQKEQRTLLNSQFSSLQEEVDGMTAKLKVLKNRYYKNKEELDEVQDDDRQQREDLVDRMRAISKTLSLNDAILAHFVPPASRSRIESRLSWDNASEDWILKPRSACPQLALTRTMSDQACRVPLSLQARSAILDGDTRIRFRPYNVIAATLERTPGNSKSFTSSNVNVRAYISSQVWQRNGRVREAAAIADNMVYEKQPEQTYRD